jgi:hypothetical protein
MRNIGGKNAQTFYNTLHGSVFFYNNNKQCCGSGLWIWYLTSLIITKNLWKKNY